MALYLYALPFGGWVSLAIVIVLALLTFVPIRYLYPSLPGLFNRVACSLGIAWTLLVRLADLEACPRRPSRRSSDRPRDVALVIVSGYPLYLPGRLVGDQRRSTGGSSCCIASGVRDRSSKSDPRQAVRRAPRLPRPAPTRWPFGDVDHGEQEARRR